MENVYSVIMIPHKINQSEMTIVYMTNVMGLMETQANTIKEQLCKSFKIVPTSEDLALISFVVMIIGKR